MGCAGKVSTGKGRSEDTKSAVIVILYRGNLNKIDPVGLIEVLETNGRFLKVNGVKPS